MLDAIGNILRFVNLGHQFQIVDVLANGASQLMSVDDARKRLARPLPARAFAKKIFILRKYHPTQCERAVQQTRIIEEVAAVLLGGQHVHLRRCKASVIASGA
jgi:hypothetical protein